MSDSAPQARAVQLAGTLAELGIRELTLRAPAQPPHQETHSPRVRETDLPALVTALLARHASCELLAPHLRITLTRETAAAEVIDEHTARRLASALPGLVLTSAAPPPPRAGASSPPA